ncbi:MAG: MOSC domain-containing protein [Saprospiraceae bacterium]|nr:MOSC domain-containing protein [Saprospiraceae bacterium]
MHHITHLFIYPVKSLGGIALSSAMALKAGFEHDRRWMLIDDQDRMITQRESPKLTLIQPVLGEQTLSLNYYKLSFTFDQKAVYGDPVITRVWDDAATAIGVDPLADEWFSEVLNQKVRLVQLHHEEARYHHATLLDMDIPVSLADGYPYLVAGSSSLEKLNQSLEHSVDFRRFRPNIVVSTSEAHEEDAWTTIRAGEATFRNAKPCARCQIIDIDPNDASRGKAVTAALATYRRSGNNVIFGTNMICEREGVVEVGQQLNLIN